jgi:hypothetical protein
MLTRAVPEWFPDFSLGLRKSAEIPTTTLYFSGPLHDLIAPGAEPMDGRPITRIAPTVFGIGEDAVVIRYTTMANLAALRRAKRIFYVIDDDLFAAIRDKALPFAYRTRLGAFVRRILPHLLDLEPAIVAPSAAILSSGVFAHLSRSLLDPARYELAETFDHFWSPKTVNCIFMGTRSHANDFASIEYGLLGACEAEPRLRITTFLGDHAPPSLRRHPQIINRHPLAWQDYQAILRDERYHIALAPALPTPLNRARSISKILDHAAVGAAGLFACQPPFEPYIANGDNGLLLGQDAEEWRLAILDLARNLPKARRIATAGRDLAAQLGNPKRVRDFWSERLLLS